MRRFGIGLALVLVVAAPAAQGVRPLTLEDYYRVKTVGGVAISPDGAWVAFTVGTRIEADNSTETHTFVVATDGSSAPREVLHDGKPTSAPRWEPNGLLRYTIDRQAFVVHPGARTPPAPAPAAPAPGVPSPDGKYAAMLVDVPAPPAPAPARSEFEKRHADRFKGVTFDWMEFQRDGQPFPAPDPRLRPAQHIALRATATAQSSDVRVTLPELRPTGLVWHPDGRSLAFLADLDVRNEQAYERVAIWTATIAGTVTQVTNDGYVHADLAYSPDGEYLSYARTYGTDMVISQKMNHGGPRDLFVRPSDGGTPINLTANWDLEPGATAWSPDGAFLYFTSTTGGEAHLFRVSVPAGRVEQVTRGARRVASLTFDRAMKRMAYTAGTHDQPGEVYTANIDGSGERKLTDVNGPFLASRQLARTERLQWPSKDGTPIEGWLTFPAGFDAARRYPLIVFSHGGPHSATGYAFDFKKHFFAAQGYFVLDTNFRSSTGYGEAFKWATWGAWGDRDGEDVMAGIDFVIGRYPANLDRARVGHTGHSYGGFMTNWLITQYPERFRAAVSGAGISNWISDYGTADIYRTKETEFFGPPWDDDARARMIRQSPITYAGRVRTPTLFVHGEVDQRVPYEEAEQMYFALRRRGIPAKMIRYDGQAHGIGGHWNNVHRMMNELEWWDTYLRK